jgi:acetolactate synthase-1/2/3 large subunit
MLGMHGTYEANLAMHGCDLMIAVGARFDDRITGRLDAFSPGSKKIHIDIDPASINKVVHVDVPILGDCGHVLEEMLRLWHEKRLEADRQALKSWWDQINLWRARDCLAYRNERNAIMPQYAIERLWALTKEHDPIISTDVGQHQMWTAQYFRFDEPNRLLTSGGLGTMGYGLPAAIGAQAANPGRLCVCISGDGSIQMNIQELATAIQHGLPVKVFLLNNNYLGMVRQWQELLHGNRLSESYVEAQPNFLELAEAYQWKGLHVTRPDELDDEIREMIAHDGPVFLNVQVVNLANCFPMIPARQAHNEMWLADEMESAEKAGV